MKINISHNCISITLLFGILFGYLSCSTELVYVLRCCIPIGDFDYANFDFDFDYGQ